MHKETDMLKIRCFKCGWAWSMSTDAIEAALANLDEGATHYPVECPKCRRVNKIAVKQMRRVARRASPPADMPPADDHA
jgi:phage FluMu protein Com